MIDEWVDLEAPPKAVAASEPVTIATVTLRHGTVKVSLSVAEGLMSSVGWPRYRVQWNRDRRQFRIKGGVDGPFEGFHPPRGPKAGDGPRRIVIRVPLPAGLKAVEGRHAASHELIEGGKALMVRVPSRFWIQGP